MKRCEQRGVRLQLGAAAADHRLLQHLRRLDRHLHLDPLHLERLVAAQVGGAGLRERHQVEAGLRGLAEIFVKRRRVLT